MLRVMLWGSGSDAVEVSAQGGRIVHIDLKSKDGEPSSLVLTGRPDQLASALRAMVQALGQEHVLQRLPARRDGRRIDYDPKEALSA